MIGYRTEFVPLPQWNDRTVCELMRRTTMLVRIKIDAKCTYAGGREMNRVLRLSKEEALT